MSRTHARLSAVAAATALALLPALAASAQTSPAPTSGPTPTAGAAGTGPTPPPTSSPTPAPATVTNADSGSTVHVTVGQQLVVHLTPNRAGEVWQEPDNTGTTLYLDRLDAGQDGTTAVFDVLDVAPSRPSPGDGLEHLSATTSTACSQQSPACLGPSSTWNIAVQIDPGTRRSTDYPCSPRPSAPPADAVYLTPADTTRTVQVPLGRDVVVDTGECSSTDSPLRPLTAGSGLFRDTAEFQLQGVDRARFRAVRAGTTSITSTGDTYCQHYLDNGYIACAGRANAGRVWHIEVQPASPPPSPCASEITVGAPEQVAVGSQVNVTGSTSATGTVRILFRKRGQTAFTARRALTPSADGTFSTPYLADDDYRLYAATDRCDSTPRLVTAAPVISGPTTARTGSAVRLTVRATPGTSLAVAFLRRGQSTFTVRRTGTATAQGLYVTSFIADTDYRYYALERPGQQSNTGLTRAR